METSDGELGDEAEVRVETTEVSGEQDLWCDGCELSVGSSVRLFEGRGLVEDKDGLINLNPLNTSSLEVGEEGLVDREEFGKEGDGLKAWLGAFRGLSEHQERDGSQHYGTSGDASLLGLLVFFKSLVEEQLEVGSIREFGNDKVVVRVEPNDKMALDHQILIKGDAIEKYHFFISEAGTSTPSA